MHTALSFKTFQKHSVIESDGVLNKGQDLWSFTEVCESWLAYGVQEENKTVPGKGAWHPETEHHLAWLLLLLPIRPSQGSHQRGGDLFQALGMPSEPSSKGGCCSLPSTQRKWHNTLRDSIMVAEIIPSLSAPTQWHKSPTACPAGTHPSPCSEPKRWVSARGQKHYPAPGQQ